MSTPNIFRKSGTLTESELRTKLLEIEAALERLDLLFFDLPGLFPPEELVSQHEDLEKEIGSLRAALAPHKKLPVELLAEIFFCCSTPRVILPPQANEPLLTLTQVCRTWRELALEVPELWASISISLTEEGTDAERITGITEQWIARAGAYPLSITVQCASPYATAVCANSDLVSGFIPLVLSHAHHLQHLDLAFPSAKLMPILALPAGAFPRLETLALRPLLLLSDMTTLETGYAAWHWPSNAVAFDSSPLVREVTYSPIPMFKLAELEVMAGDVMERAMAAESDVGTHPFFAPAFPLPWSQLSTISFPFTALPAEAWCAVVTECPGLAYFEVAIKPEGSNQPGPTPDPPLVRLDSLHYLSISAFCGGGDALLDRLVAPQLTTFVLMGTLYTTASLLAFHARSNFALETFIPVMHIPAADVAALFQALHALQTLIILAVSSEHFPAAFWARVGRADLLPNLAALLIRPTDAQAPVLVDMIAARWEAAVAGLGPGVSVGFCDVRPAHLAAVNDELRRLEKYAEGGRAVDILNVC